MRLAHVLVTRFSYDAAGTRADWSAIRPDHATVNPLAPRRLERRFLLFETFCLPSVLNQTNRAFVWLLIVDPRLGASERHRLRALTSPHADTHLVDYHPQRCFGRLGWLRSYIHPAATHIATTNVDDDDIMAVDLVDYVQRYVRGRHDSGSCPPCLLVGCVSPPQWDLMAAPDAPFGYLKPWHRHDGPTFAAYTACCAQPHYDLSVLGFEHSLGAAYFEPSIVLDDVTQQALREAAHQAGHDWRTWRASDHLHLLRKATPPVVVVNHLENDQMMRVFEGWEARRIVSGPADLPGMIVAFDRIPELMRSFRRTPAALVRYWRRMAGMVAHTQGLRRRRILLNALTSPLWFWKRQPGDINTPR